MRFHERQMAMPPGNGGLAHRPNPRTPYFDHAAYRFFVRYNGEPPDLSLHDFLDLFERAVVYETLLRNHGSQKTTADLLKVKKQTLNAKVKKQHILITKQVIKET
jgi:DNA-binding NtrC family response regulator